jgi:carbohydrate-binding DOMON domain-containing protein
VPRRIDYGGGVLLMKTGLFWGLLSLLLLALCLMGASATTVYFQMADPINDEHGYGSYQYPTNIAFQPYQGLFDIIEFKVQAGEPGGEPGWVYFDTRFAKVTNPWVAPEGFIHENLRIFINKQPNRGLTVLAHSGANVRFNPKYGWEIGLRIVGWGNSQLLTMIDQNTVKVRPLKVELLNDHQTIRAYVPEELIGVPLKSWRYYVLVGSYDGFGEDFFRKVAPKSSEWIIGGSSGLNIEPRVLDTLAPDKGSHSQTRQLTSFDPHTRALAELYPVAASGLNMDPISWLVIFIIIACISGVIYIVLKEPKRISWFWVHRAE